jgi:hypothetical protein
MFDVLKFSELKLSQDFYYYFNKNKTYFINLMQLNFNEVNMKNF